MKNSTHFKKSIQTITTLAFIGAFSALLWVKNAGAITFTEEGFALFTVPWIAGNTGLLLLMYISWFKPNSSNNIYKKTIFVSISIFSLVLWYGIWNIFILYANPLSTISTNIKNELTANNWEYVDFRKLSNIEWDKVCFLGPYSNNIIAAQTTGFSWNIEKQTSIYNSDGITLIAFIKNSEVVRQTEHPRNLGDFANLTSKCFDYNEAIFSSDIENNKWHRMKHTISK